MVKMLRFSSGLMVLILFLIMLMTGCSGSSISATNNGSTSSIGSTSSSSSSGGSALAATSLTVASQVSVVDPELGQLGLSTIAASSIRVDFPSIARLFKSVARSSLTPTSDFNTDVTSVSVTDISTNALDNVNKILCMVSQSKYDAMLNKGNYLALVDNNLCDSSRSDASNAGSTVQDTTGASNVPLYSMWTISSSRVDDNSPEIVKCWIHQAADATTESPAQMIYADAVITEGTTSVNPYGIFTINFEVFPVSNGVVASTSAEKGILEAVRDTTTGKVLLKYVDTGEHGDGNGGTQQEIQKISLDRHDGGTGGAGHVLTTQISSQGTSTMEYDIAYDTTYFYRVVPNTSSPNPICLNRTVFNDCAWSYNLYDMTGTRVDLNSGFPITFTLDGVDHQGYIGYYGLWTDTGVNLSNGTSVNKVAYNNGNSSSVPYTIFESGGELQIHTRHLMTLGDLTNVPLSYFAMPTTQPSGTNQPMSNPTGTNYEVYWDGANFVMFAQMPQMCSGNCTWANLPQPYPTIDFSSLHQGSINLNSTNNGGQFQVMLSNCTVTPQPGIVTGITSTGTGTQPGPAPTPQPEITVCDPPANASQVIYYDQNIVYPGDRTVPTTLVGYQQTPIATSSGVDPSNPYGTNNSMMSAQTNTPTVYTFDSTNLMLMYNGYDVVMTSTGTSNNNQFGVMSGPLFDPSAIDSATGLSYADLIMCDWSTAQNPQVCGWKAMGVLPVYYTWETGPNNFNQFITVKDGAGNFVKFDAPLYVNYVSGGTTYVLQYGGAGQLNGIPGQCIDLNTGTAADCAQSANSNSIIWVPQFTIPAASSSGVPTVLTGGSNQYYVKPLQVQQMMTASPLSDCANLATTDFSQYVLPDASLWVDPVAFNGVEPTVTSAPAVIGGVVQ
ncbi:MAG TPA: hypothetical protein VEI57_04095 [Nitrospirota bacterium]|nr:hypothetical protein [Nitrospirota bacterium]